MPARGGGWMNLPAVVFAKPNAEVQDRAHRNWSRSKQSNFAARCSDQTLKWNHWDQRRCHLLFLSTCLQTLKNSHQWMASLIFGSEECLRPSRKSMKLCRNEHDKCSTRTHTQKKKKKKKKKNSLIWSACARHTTASVVGGVVGGAIDSAFGSVMWIVLWRSWACVTIIEK